MEQLILNIASYELGPDAFRYLCLQLEQGGPLTSALKLSPEGKVWAYIPLRALPRQHLDDFIHGAVFTAEDAYEILQNVIHLIGEFLGRDASNVALAEDQFFRLDDPPNATQTCIFQHAGKTYHYRTGVQPESTLRDAEQLINRASHYPLILILTKIPSDISLPQRGTIDERLARELVDGIQHVIVGAYDEEGYLIWSPQSAAPRQ